jgi:hypothetical protein
MPKRLQPVQVRLEKKEYDALTEAKNHTGRSRAQEVRWVLHQDLVRRGYLEEPGVKP